jgi:hypothetical protein
MSLCQLSNFVGFHFKSTHPQRLLNWPVSILVVVYFRVCSYIRRLCQDYARRSSHGIWNGPEHRDRKATLKNLSIATSGVGNMKYRCLSHLRRDKTPLLHNQFSTFMFSSSDLRHAGREVLFVMVVELRINIGYIVAY